MQLDVEQAKPSSPFMEPLGLERSSAALGQGNEHAGPLALFLLDVRLKLKRALAFRANFFANLAIALFHSFAFSILQFFVYSSVHGYPGWSPEQMLLFQATLMFWTGVRDFLWGGIRQLIDIEVVHGNVDRLFLLPRHALVSLFSRGADIYALAAALAGLTGIVAMLARLRLWPSLGALLGFSAFFSAGLVFYLALLILYAGATLFWVRMERLREVLDRILFFGSFPADVYFGRANAPLLALFPLALWVHLPTQALLGRASNSGAWSILVALFCFGAALAYWRRQERNYTSAGG